MNRLPPAVQEQLATPSLDDLPHDAFCSHLQAAGWRQSQSTAMWSAWQRGQLDSLPAKWREFINSQPAAAMEPVQETVSSDGLTRKFLLRLHDGRTIETVLMGYTGRRTACVSTQVGCAMGCVFCATGQAGFIRHLRTAEIVGQVRFLRRYMHQEEGVGHLRNVVFMGMGEPLHNFDATMDTVDILCDSRGLNLGPSRITVSTVGHVPGIRRMADERRACNLAVSLHAVDQQNRQRLIPVAERWDLEQLRDACHYYIETSGKRIFFEWTLISEENDDPAQARQLVAWLEGMDAHVNLIPLNPTQDYHAHPAQAEAVRTFHAVLRDAGLPVTVRQRRGIAVAAGCGQLAGRKGVCPF